MLADTRPRFAYRARPPDGDCAAADAHGGLGRASPSTSTGLERRLRVRRELRLVGAAARARA